MATSSWKEDWEIPFVPDSNVLSWKQKTLKKKKKKAGFNDKEAAWIWGASQGKALLMHKLATLSPNTSFFLYLNYNKFITTTQWNMNLINNLNFAQHLLRLAHCLQGRRVPYSIRTVQYFKEHFSKTIITKSFWDDYYYKYVGML